MGKKHTTRSKKKAELKDSGSRTASTTGSLRDRGPDHGVTHGRFDLIPPECIAAVGFATMPESLAAATGGLCAWLAEPRLQFGDGPGEFARFVLASMGSEAEGLRRVAVHYGRGAAKYADRNWEKGQQTGWLVDSLFRHLGKMRMGLTDEDHAAAVVWNCFALMWTRARIDDGRLPRELDTYGLCK